MSSKVAAYLQEHILGEVATQPAILDSMSRDASILEITPEMVVYPRVTSDIRKITRFAWQLAEKGHVLPITARGAGSDQTGGAIGKGIIVSTTAHMNGILEFDPKQKLVRVQPGLTAKALNDALMLEGLGIPVFPRSAVYSTVGGAIANNASGPLSGKYGDMRDWVQQLEVVLANGDLIQTARLNKRDLNKKKGLQTFEGEIYRNLDNLIEDNKQIIDEKLGGSARDNAGYALSQVKRKDGSFDLAPLFVGSQGTLGIVSEMILKSEYVSMHTGVAVAAFTSYEAARDAADTAKQFDPAFIEYYDSEYFTHAANHGKQYAFYKELDTLSAAVLVIGFDDFNEHARGRKLKKLGKMLQATEASVTSADGEEAAEVLAVREVVAYWGMQEHGMSAPPLFEGAYIPPERFEEFSRAVVALSAKHHVKLPLRGSAMESIYSTSPILNMKKVGDKQKTFKLLDDYSQLVEQYGGHLAAEAGEGRVKARFAYANLDDDVLDLFVAVKAVFDPSGILNPGVKQTAEVRQLVSWLGSDHASGTLSGYVPY